MSEAAPTLHRVAEVIRSGPFAKATLYRLIRKGRVPVERVGKRMVFTRETGNEIAVRIAREDREAKADLTAE